MATQSRGNRTNFGWLKKSCDISTCDLSLDGNPDKYGRPMKSAIITSLIYFQFILGQLTILLEIINDL